MFYFISGKVKVSFQVSLKDQQRIFSSAYSTTKYNMHEDECLPVLLISTGDSACANKFLAGEYWLFGYIDTRVNILKKAL